MKIAIATGARSEYGILKPIIRSLDEDPSIELYLIVSAMHLSQKFGYTVSEIEADGFDIAARVPMLGEGDGVLETARAVGTGTSRFAEVLDQVRVDILIIVGDRFEALAAAQAAMFMGVPIAHIHGGEVTTHAIDDSIRHAISKMSTFHFTSTEAYRQRLIQMGEQPSRVVVSGAPALDVVLSGEFLSQVDLEEQLDFEFRDVNFLVTYHSVTAGDGTNDSVEPLLAALREFPRSGFIVTYPNADDGNTEIIDALKRFKTEMADNVCLIPSLGQTRYFSALRYVTAVVGNSSSGLIEVPSFKIATVNIGKRQFGRIQSDSVINCRNTKGDISEALTIASSEDFREFCKTVENPYGKGNAADVIVDNLKARDLKNLGPKVFYDLDLEKSDNE